MDVRCGIALSSSRIAAVMLSCELICHTYVSFFIGNTRSFPILPVLFYIFFHFLKRKRCDLRKFRNRYHVFLMLADMQLNDVSRGSRLFLSKLLNHIRLEPSFSISDLAPESRLPYGLHRRIERTTNRSPLRTAISSSSLSCTSPSSPGPICSLSSRTARQSTSLVPVKNEVCMIIHQNPHRGWQYIQTYIQQIRISHILLEAPTRIHGGSLFSLHLKD